MHGPTPFFAPQELKRAGWSADDLAKERKGHTLKVAIARRLREEIAIVFEMDCGGTAWEAGLILNIPSDDHLLRTDPFPTPPTFHCGVGASRQVQSDCSAGLSLSINDA